MRAVVIRLTRSSRRIAVTALVAVLLVPLAACGDDDESLAADEGTETTASESSPETSTSEPPSGTAGGDPEAGAGPDAVLIELGDLPAGWEQLPPEAVAGDDAGSCLDALVTAGGPFDDSDDRTSARAFSQSSLGTFLMTAAARPVDDGAAVVSDVEAVLLACDGETDASGYTTSMEPAPAPDGVDGAIAFRGTASDDRGAQVSYLIAAAPAGDAVVLAGHAVALGKLDPQLVDDALATMVAKAA